MLKHLLHSKIIHYLEPFNPKKIAVFGSYARGEQTKNSDLDILIDFKDSSWLTLFKMIEMEEELTNILGVKVDLISEDAIQNERLKKYIYSHLDVIYAKG